MFAALLLTGFLATIAVEDAPAEAAPDMDDIREQFIAHESSTSPVHLSALSQVVFQRGRFSDGIQRSMQLVQYDVHVEGNLTPAGPGDEAVRFEVIQARRELEAGRELIVAPATVVRARWTDGYANLEVAPGRRLHGNDRTDLAQILGVDAPDVPTMLEIVNWPEGAAVGDRWVVDVVAFQKRLNVRGFEAQLHDLGGEATLLGPRAATGEQDAKDDTEQPALRVLLWADQIELVRHFDTYTGQLEERHEFYIRSGATTPWRHVWSIEQSLFNVDTNTPSGRHVTNEFFARNATDLQVRPIEP